MDLSQRVFVKGIGNVMAKTKQEEKVKVDGLVFTVGVNLSDDRRFEAGDAVPADITAEDYKALNDCIEAK